MRVGCRSQLWKKESRRAVLSETDVPRGSEASMCVDCLPFYVPCMRAFSSRLYDKMHFLLAAHLYLLATRLENEINMNSSYSIPTWHTYFYNMYNLSCRLDFMQSPKWSPCAY